MPPGEIEKKKNDDGERELHEMERILFPLGTKFDEDRQKLLFEYYKLLAQSFEQLAARRQAANGFFLSLNTFLLAGVGFIFKESFELYVHEHRVARLMILAFALSIIGFVIDTNWSRLINSYHKILRNQVRVLEAFERHTMAAIVTAQVVFHRKDFHALSLLEKNIANTFQVIFLLCLAGAIVLMLMNPLNFFHETGPNATLNSPLAPLPPGSK
jgi:hypothetical protein